MNKPILGLKNIKKYYEAPGLFFGKKSNKLRALDGINLSVAVGQKIGIVGESGCGKSTLSKVIMRLVEPSSGKINLFGEEITTLSPKALNKIRKDIQIIFQDPFSSLNPRMRIGEIISEPLYIHQEIVPDQIKNEVISIMAAVGLTEDYFDRFPHQLSGGQRQRVGIARALILKPKIIIADEPVSALDVSIQAQLLNLLNKLHEDYNLTMIFISHDISVVQHTCDIIAVMYLGQIIEMGEANSLIQNPKHPYTEALISAVPQINFSKNSNKNKIVLHGDVPTAFSPPSGCRFHTRCIYVKERCKKEVPVLAEINRAHHLACHYPLIVS